MTLKELQSYLGKTEYESSFRDYCELEWQNKQDFKYMKMKMKENWCLVNQSLQLNTGWHWMILFVGLMLEIYHCWWPLQERIPPICPWGWSDTDYCPVPWTIYTLPSKGVWSGQICLWEWSFMDRLSVFLSSGVVLLRQTDHSRIFGMVWFIETFCLLSPSSGSITMWYKISCLLYKLYFCQVCSQMPRF